MLGVWAQAPTRLQEVSMAGPLASDRLLATGVTELRPKTGGGGRIWPECSADQPAAWLALHSPRGLAQCKKASAPSQGTPGWGPLLPVQGKVARVWLFANEHPGGEGLAGYSLKPDGQRGQSGTKLCVSRSAAIGSSSSGSGIQIDTREQARQAGLQAMQRRRGSLPGWYEQLQDDT